MTEWLSLLRNQDLSVRERASDALARFGPGSLPHMRRLLSAQDPTLRRSVVVTLGKIGPEAVPVIPSMLKRMAREQVALIRAEILKALTVIDPKAPGVAEEFEKRLRDEAAQVQQAARLGLQALEPPKAAPQSSQTDRQQPEDTSYQLREAVSAKLDQEGVAFGIAAEVVRESRRAAILWPGIKSGQIVGSQMVAFVFEQRGDSQWTPIASRVDLSKGPGRLVELLEGADKQRVVRPCGVAKGQLTAFLEEHAKSFKQALEANQPQEAMQAFEQLSKAFSFRMVAYSSTLLELIASGALGRPGWKLDVNEGSDSHTVEAQLSGKKRTGRARLTSCADGYVIAELEWN